MNKHYAIFFSLKGKMDDIMILMHKVIIDIQGFDDTQFGIFDDNDQLQLLHMWQDTVNRDVRRFISALSPSQKYRVALWASNRTTYTVKELTTALEKFIKFLKSSSYSNHDTYPKPLKRERHGTIFKRKKLIK